jgi:hypothetical protein
MARRKPARASSSQSASIEQIQQKQSTAPKQCFFYGRTLNAFTWSSFQQMSQSYIDGYFLAGTNEQLMLDKCADLENNDAWWNRAKIRGKTAYIRRNTCETERMPAERFAVDAWHSLQGKHKAGLKRTAKVVRDVVKDFFEQVSATKQNYEQNINTTFGKAIWMGILVSR